MESCPIGGIPINQDKLVSNEILSNLYEGTNVTEGGGREKAQKQRKVAKTIHTTKNTSNIPKFTSKGDFTLETAINEMNSQIRRSRRLQGLSPSNDGMEDSMEMAGGGEEEDKQKAIENTQMMTFGIIATIIIGASSTDLANVLLDFTKQSAMSLNEYMVKYGGEAWTTVQPQIQNFGNAYWRQVGTESLCNTNMDYALDRAMRYPLISGYIGGDGFWESCATRLSKYDDKVMALSSLAYKTITLVGGTILTGTFLGKYMESYNKEGFTGVRTQMKDEVLSLFEGLKSGSMTTLNFTQGIISDFFQGGILVSKKVISGVGNVYYTSVNGSNVPLTEVVEVPSGATASSGQTNTLDNYGFNKGGKKRKTKRNKKTKRKSHHKKKSYKKRK